MDQQTDRHEEANNHYSTLRECVGKLNMYTVNRYTMKIIDRDSKECKTGAETPYQ
jgi:hypothetical protein